MDRADDPDRVIVVGAGVAGCASARELAPDHEVRVLDREGVAAGATGLAAGVIAPTLFYRDLPAAARHANAFFRAFDGTAGFSFTERPRLDVIRPDGARAARETAAKLADEGFPVAWLDAEDVAASYPRVRPDGFAGAVEYGDAGWVDPHEYATALAAAAAGRGATVETGVTVEALLVEDGRTVGVATDAGPRYGDRVVVAAGPATPGLVDVPLPVRAYRTQCVVLDPAEPPGESFPIGRIGDLGLYFRPERGGGLLVGGAHEPVDDPAAASRDADESFTLEVADAIPDLLAGFTDAGIASDWAGVDAATPDARPIVDAPTAGPDGLVVATGFNGLGIMASPIAGSLVRALVTGEPAPVPRAAFALDRFDRADRADRTDDEFDLYTTSEI